MTSRINFHYKTAVFLTDLLEERFQAGKFKFGLDPVLGLIPGLGDIVTIVLASYLVWIAKELAVPEEKIGVMLRNITVDLVIGLVPFFGDIGDFVFKANSRNLAIIREHLESLEKKEKEVIEGHLLN